LFETWCLELHPAGEQWQKALSLLEMMPEARLQPNVISYSEPSGSSACRVVGNLKGGTL